MYTVSVSVVSIVLSVMAACSGGPTQPDRVPTGKPFELKVGETALTTDDVRIKFDIVRSDSRCPIDAVCVRAGEAVIAITVGRVGEVPEGRELDTTPAKSSTTFLNYTITLSSLQPFPRSDRQTQPGDYIGTFIVQAK
jgi:hypothetical protein